MNRRSARTTVRIVRAALIAALYAGLSLSLPWISFGPVQFRVSEALTILPLLFPEAAIGVTVGCVIANSVASSWIDALIGGATTFVAALLTALSGALIRKTPLKITLGVIPPILLNAITVPFVFLLTGAGIGYWFGLATVLAGQLVCILGLGIPLYFATAKIYKTFANRTGIRHLNAPGHDTDTPPAEQPESCPEGKE